MMSKYTKSAKGQECQIRIPSVCNFNPETTVLAHLNGGGMGMKSLDIHGAYACSDCHDYVDHRNRARVFPDWDLKIWHMEGVIRTQKIMVEAGILKL